MDGPAKGMYNLKKVHLLVGPTYWKRAIYIMSESQEKAAEAKAEDVKKEEVVAEVEVTEEASASAEATGERCQLKVIMPSSA